MEAIVNNLIKAIGWSILHSLWQGAILYIFLFVAFLAFPKMSARLKHNLAFSTLVVLFISFCLTFLFIFKLPSSSLTAQISIEQLSFQELNYLTQKISFKTESYFPLIVSIYGIGILLQFVVLLSSYAKLKKLKNEHTLVIPAEWKSVFELTLAQLKLNKTVKFYLSTKVNVPLVIGFLKPVVLFPFALATQLDLKQVEAILIHELSHIRRNDYLINLVKTCIETLLFFNPFVWLTTRFIHIEREHACDDLVVNFTGTPLTYAHALLKLELLKSKNTPALSLAATGKNQHLYQRIKRITDMKTNYMNAKQKFFILSLTIGTVISLAWINPTKKPEETKKVSSFVELSEAKSIKKHLTLDIDTDSVKTKRSRTWVSKENGKNVIYYSYDEMPENVKAKFKALDKKFNSPEWKEKMAKIEKNGLELEKKFNSPEWKEKIAKIEKNGLELEKKFNSPEWKAKMEKIEKDGLELEKKFNSPEWKAKMAKIEFDSKQLEKKFNSPEWKQKMAKIEKNGLELEKKFNSPEWKEKMAKIEKNSLELEKKFNSPAWKKQIEEMKQLQESSEYKELRKKYENDLQELKKKKGIKAGNSPLILDGSNLEGVFSSLDKDFLAFASAQPLNFKATDFKFENLSPMFEAISIPLTAPVKAKTN